MAQVIIVGLKGKIYKYFENYGKIINISKKK